ncbi:MAG: cytochrome c family protein, partial [Rhodospirillaceae bacterium]|nr:cytochrome c family protein [Rhodospirillaceae bacterium]
MSLEMNKIAGAVLVGGLVTLGSSILAEKLVTPQAAHVAVAVPQAPAEAPAPAPEKAVEPVSALLASADPAAGEATAKKCAVCHTFDKGGAAKLGPNLWGVVGGPHAHMEGFAYSDAMKKLHDQPWTYEDLNAFLAHPQKTIPGTKMTFPGLPKVQDRANVIAWLRTKSDSPVPPPSEADIKAATEAAQPTQQAAAAPAQPSAQPAAAEAGQPAAETAPAQAPQPSGSDIATLLQSADPTEGQKVAKKCAVCHTFEKGAPNKVGPNLYGVVGGPHAHKEDFKYSEAMSKLHDQPWTYEALDAFLTSPKDAVPGTKMAFPGLRKPEERAAVIAYLRTLSDSPPPLPQPGGGAAAQQPEQSGGSSEASPVQPAEGGAPRAPPGE